MRVAVCDDNKVVLNFLSREISERLDLHSIQHEMRLFSCGELFLEQHEITPFDIVFLDIKMPNMDGFSVAKKIRNQSENTYIIFITTEDNLVYDSFDFRPFNFIPKGNDDILKVKLDNVIGKLAEHICENRPICFTLPFGEKKYVFPSDIIYILSKSNYADIICKTDNIHIRNKIDDILDLLTPKYFARIHNRCIVNMKHLCRIDNTRFKALLDNGKELDISRAYKAVLIEKYNVFLRDFT